MENTIKYDVLLSVLKEMLHKNIITATYEMEQLKGGTVGDVRLVSGIAKTSDNEELPYKVVWKKQRKWERFGDPQSWRREYDLYKSQLEDAFDDTLRWPKCFFSEINDTQNELWIEFVDGVSGYDLTTEMMEKAALELGRFQGRISKEMGKYKSIECLGDRDFLRREFEQWHHESFSYDFLISEPCRMPKHLKELLKTGEIRNISGKSFEYGAFYSDWCQIPEHLKQMMSDIDNRRDEIFHKLNKLPVILNHRDFWVENVFYQDGKIRLIDWDTSGWGILGEDIVSLMVDDVDPNMIEEYNHRLLPMYLKGLSENMDVPSIQDLCIPEMALIMFGYSHIQGYIFAEDDDDRNECIEFLQKIYEMFENNR